MDDRRKEMFRDIPQTRRAQGSVRHTFSIEPGFISRCNITAASARSPVPDERIYSKTGRREARPNPQRSPSRCAPITPTATASPQPSPFRQGPGRPYTAGQFDNRSAPVLGLFFVPRQSWCSLVARPPTVGQVTDEPEELDVVTT